METNRRKFLTGVGAAAIATAARPILGANDRVNLAVIGLGGRGKDHVNYYLKLPTAQITGLCDVNQAAVERAQAQVERAGQAKPKGYPEMRQVFDNKDIDAVSMATPNHWHALGTIWACQAGKHVYVEKPACHNIYEGRKMVEAARKYNRCVQIGTQGRSMPHKRQAMDLLAKGEIGDVYMAKGLCFKRRKSIGHKENEPTPAGLNWDAFLGPAPLRPYNELRFRYNWHWFWDTGNGDIGNQGIHEMDVARWGLGVGIPETAFSTGGKYVYKDDQETPNTQLAALTYPGKELQFEVRGILTGPEGQLLMRSGFTIGDLFFGSEGWMNIDDASFQVYKGEKHEKTMEGKGPSEDLDTTPHMQNFLDAVKANNPKGLNADVAIGVESAALVHYANISYRLGRKLKIDPATWRMVNDDEANQMLTRKYRAPYIVPEKV